MAWKSPSRVAAWSMRELAISLVASHVIRITNYALPTVLRYWCELGRVCSQEELDARFLAAASAGMVGAVAKASAK